VSVVLAALVLAVLVLELVQVLVPELALERAEFKLGLVQALAVGVQVEINPCIGGIDIEGTEVTPTASSIVLVLDSILVLEALALILTSCICRSAKISYRTAQQYICEHRILILISIPSILIS